MKLHYLATVSALLMITSSNAMAGCNPSVNGSLGQNTCIGSGVLSSNTGGTYNTAVGYNALPKNTTGTNNIAVGTQSMNSETTASSNVAIGRRSLGLLVTGNYNIAVGDAALGSLSAANSGSNIAIGASAGVLLNGGSGNIYIGSVGTTNSNGTESNTIRIGIPSAGMKTFIAGIRNQTVTGGAQVLVSSTGQLGALSSSRRYKDDINTIGNVGDELQKLRPVTFRYKQADEEGKKPLQYGLIAEEVDAVMPQLVIRNQDGSPETVAYQYLPTLLLSEYQKDHKKLVEAEKSIQELKSEIDELKRITKKLAQGSSSKNKTASLQ